MGNYEVYRKFVGITLETERTTVAVADDKRKIATIDKLTVKERSLINMPVAVIRYQYDNHLGSASLELDQAAQIISYEEYHPFGSTSYRSGKSETEVSQKRYKYVGKEKDEETGLYYYGARYYAAWIGRFVSVDPLQFDYPQLTPFNYAGNKPVTHIDIDGMQSTGDKPYGTEVERSGEIYLKGAIVNNQFGKWIYQGDGKWLKPQENDKLPWYYRENKYGGKPVLTLGIPNLPLAEKFNYSEYPITDWLAVLVSNCAIDGWNGFASNLNDALDGKTGTDMLQEMDEYIRSIKVEDLSKVEFWESVGGMVLLGYLTKSAKSVFSKSPVKGNAPLVGNKVTANSVTNAGETLGEFGIPKNYTYTKGGNSVFVHPHAMKHLEELATHGNGNSSYLRLIGQIYQKALHSAIDDVLSRGPIEYRKMYYSGGNEIMFGTPKTDGLLPAVIHFR